MKKSPPTAAPAAAPSQSQAATPIAAHAVASAIPGQTTEHIVSRNDRAFAHVPPPNNLPKGNRNVSLAPVPANLAAVLAIEGGLPVTAGELKALRAAQEKFTRINALITQHNPRTQRELRHAATDAAVREGSAETLGQLQDVHRSTSENVATFQAAKVSLINFLAREVAPLVHPLYQRALGKVREVKEQIRANDQTLAQDLAIPWTPGANDHAVESLEFILESESEVIKLSGATFPPSVYLARLGIDLATATAAKA